MMLQQKSLVCVSHRLAPIVSHQIEPLPADLIGERRSREKHRIVRSVVANVKDSSGEFRKRRISLHQVRMQLFVGLFVHSIHPYTD